MKLFINRIIETSRFLSTDAGQQLTDFINYMADLAEQVVRTLRNGLTFGDNFSCSISDVELRSATQLQLQTTGSVFGVLLVGQSQEVSRWHWGQNDQGVYVVATFVSAAKGKCKFVILYN